MFQRSIHAKEEATITSRINSPEEFDAELIAIGNEPVLLVVGREPFVSGKGGESWTRMATFIL